MKMAETVLLMMDGDIQGLVSLAMLNAQEHEVVGLIVDDGRMGMSTADACVARQLQHFGISRLIHRRGGEGLGGKQGNQLSYGGLSDLMIVLQAMDQAVVSGLSAVAWPVCGHGHFPTAARLTESGLMVHQLVEMWTDQSVVLDMPLLDMTLGQVIEIGQQMAVPWQMTYSCRVHAETPCGQCQWCVRRRDAFLQAGLEDPLVIGTTPAPVELTEEDLKELDG